MKRYPNPWVFGPALIGLIIGAWLGYFISELSGTGTFLAVVVAALTGLAAAVGVGIVAVLAIRSFDESKTAHPPTAGCEVPDPD